MPIADLKIGLRHSWTVLVGDHLAVPAMSESYTGFSDMPPVFATAFMIGLVEWACAEALSPFLGAGAHTVGIHVDVSHVSATPGGMKATAEVGPGDIPGRQLGDALAEGRGAPSRE